MRAAGSLSARVESAYGKAGSCTLRLRTECRARRGSITGGEPVAPKLCSEPESGSAAPVTLAGSGIRAHARGCRRQHAAEEHGILVGIWPPATDVIAGNTHQHDALSDFSWRAELAARVRALEVDGEHSEAMGHDEPEKDEDMVTWRPQAFL